MTRPGEPIDDRPMPPPADPWATIDRPAATVYFGGADPTADVDPSGQTVRRPGPNPNAPADPPGSTVHLGSPGPAGYPGSPGPTVHLGSPGAAGHPGSPGPTVHLGSAGPAGYPGSAGPTAHLGSPGPAGYPGTPAPPARADEELRFGPGVPAAQAATPGWPATAPARRRRPLWRRLVSVLSSLLTLALVVVVGLYLWQRLRPLVVQSATVAVPRPAGNRCNVTVDVVATVHTNGRGGVIRYQWFRSDAPPGAVLTEQVGSGQRTAALTLKWTFSGVGTTTATATVNIIDPTPMQAGTQVVYRCRRD